MPQSNENITLEKVPDLELIVFDLDYTLWPFWVDTHVTPPFRKTSIGEIVDAYGQRIKHYLEVPLVLQQLTAVGYKLGVASRTSAVEEAKQLLTLFDWRKYFLVSEIYPGSKITHFNEMHRKTKIPFSKMLFFDDEHRNIKDLTAKGVVSILVENCVDLQVVKSGINQFAKKRTQE
ncbi:magnesium-dependent phosphatase 1-like protein [Dinothrombium tinctorium]|uniref:Magnesium-dependent phosphatase 1-like protein n=1 Tax=Dinothrombium tinctorium TaxID=1965070 RepID=A0A3S3SMH2_9ACAR|nr:magnesium-dependent phosphatase 1-like protein [Dinothrombium tinctorium]